MLSITTAIGVATAINSINQLQIERRVSMLAQDSLRNSDIVKELKYNHQEVVVFKDGSTMLCGTLTNDESYAVYLSFEDLQRLALEARLGKTQ